MIPENKKNLFLKIRMLIILFMIGLIVSGITAFPIEILLSLTMKYLYLFPDFIKNWLSIVYIAIHNTNETYPFLSYGTDWLAFAHIVIAVVFIGPLKDPVKNIWVIQFGMIACMMVVPLALIAGYIREIPFFWRIIDCSFGFWGFILLVWCYRCIKNFMTLEKVNEIK